MIGDFVNVVDGGSLEFPINWKERWKINLWKHNDLLVTVGTGSVRAASRLYKIILITILHFHVFHLKLIITSHNSIM